MPLFDAHVVPLLMAIAAIAVLLGLLANVLAMRLLLDLDRTANDPVFRRTRAHRTPGVNRSRPALYLVS